MLMMRWHTQAKMVSKNPMVPLNDLSPNMPIGINENNMPYEDNR